MRVGPAANGHAAADVSRGDADRGIHAATLPLRPRSAGTLERRCWSANGGGVAHPPRRVDASDHARTPAGRRGATPMTYTIAEPCIDVKDKACVEECPVDCIYEGERMLYIQPDECVDCGACE